jgi:hypothetical protein
MMPRPRATRTVQDYDTDGSESAYTPPSSDERIHNTATVRRNAKAVDISKLRQLLLNKKSAEESDMAARKGTHYTFPSLDNVVLGLMNA